MRCVIIGMGGSGTWIARQLLSVLQNRVEKFIFCDGDSFSTSNKERQDFLRENVNKNKAEAKAEELQPYTAVPIDVVDDYLGENNIFSIISDGDIVISAVDCTGTKRMIDEYCKELDTVLLISLGNELYDGDSQISLRIGGEQITPALVEYNKDIEQFLGKTRSEMSCEEIGSLPSGGQHVVANIQNATVGTIVCNQILDITNNLTTKIKYPYRAVFFDTQALRMKPEQF